MRNLIDKSAVLFEPLEQHRVQKTTKSEIDKLIGKLKSTVNKSMINSLSIFNNYDFSAAYNCSKCPCYEFSRKNMIFNLFPKNMYFFKLT